MHENKHNTHLHPLGYNPLVAFKNGPWYACQVLWQNKNKQKDHSPSMTLSELPKQNDQVP